jgi:hypothetical protein
VLMLLFDMAESHPVYVLWSERTKTSCGECAKAVTCPVVSICTAPQKQVA